MAEESDHRTSEEVSSVSRIRVAAYVLRERTSWELLVFEQVGLPHAGVQIPAGGVQANETPQMAVLREVYEETGLHELEVRAELHTEHKAQSSTGMPRTTTFFVVDAPCLTPTTWTHTVHGDGADAGMTFKCRFEPLPLQRRLADDQDAGLGLIDIGFTTLARHQD
jgi:8-oxo-dGTP pyrophosphatase MutT (NUDIX family)